MQGGLTNRINKRIKGYVIIAVEGFFIEKFTNLCAINNIDIKNAKKISTMKMKAEINIKDFIKLRRQAKKSGCKIKLLEKKGLPFLIFRYRKRKWFALGIFFFIIIIFSVTSFIWKIEVRGNETISSEEIISNLKELGVKTGQIKYKLDNVRLSYELMLKRDDISFVGIDVSGVKVTIKIIEKIKIPEIIPKNEPCDIIAKKTGLIIEYKVLAGTKKVNTGDTVTKGQLLVSKEIDMINFPEKKEYVHAMADVIARVWYEKSERLKIFNEIGKEKTEIIAYKIAKEKIMRDVGKENEITDEKVNYIYEDDYVTANIIIETRENIAEENKGNN